MKNRKQVLDEIKKTVKEEIKNCKKYNTLLFKEMTSARAQKNQQVKQLLEASAVNDEMKQKYQQVLEILNSIKM